MTADFDPDENLLRAHVVDRGIRATCSGCQLVQTLYCPDHGELEAGVLAGLMDGSFFATPPGPESSVGKCGACGAPFRCELFGYGESAAACSEVDAPQTSSSATE